VGKPQAVHRTRHLNIRENNPNIVSVLEYRNRLDCAAGFDGTEPRVLSRRDGAPTEQRFVLDNKHDRLVARLMLHQG
jgi:hypothetical protein